MRRLLDPENEGLLLELAASKVLLAFDFDGTLAPIVRHREDAMMRSRTAKLFARLCGLYPCAVITGRSKTDVSARLVGAPVEYVVGNHGLEGGGGLGDFEREVARARPILAAALAGLEGLELEDKRYSLAVHYRHARDKRRARDAIARAVSRLPVPLRVVPGKLVVNLVPVAAANKGDALLALWTSAGANAALYVGDDATDEDVFRLAHQPNLFTVRIRPSKTSSAAFSLRDQLQIDILLARLVGLRAQAERS